MLQPDVITLTNVKEGSSQQLECEKKAVAECATRQDVQGDYTKVVNDLRARGYRLRSDRKQPSLLAKPAWFNKELYDNAKSVYARHFMAINFAHLSGLLLLVRVDSIFKTLSSTGESSSVSKLFCRYYQTIMHVKKWYEGDIFEEANEAHRSLLIVRGMHNRVSSNLNKTSCPAPSDETPVKDAAPKHTSQSKENLLQDTEAKHLSEYDIMITQFAFVGFIVLHAKSVGLVGNFTQHDLDSLLHFWRVICYYLGASEEFNLCSRQFEDIRGMCNAFVDSEYKRSILANPISSAPGIMSVNIVRSIKFIPMLTIYGMLKYLYDLLDISTSEFESRSTRYARLSHYLIGLVMTKLLGYKLLRMFNNGLVRLSLYLVGTAQNRFANHLESKHGHELKAM